MEGKRKLKVYVENVTNIPEFFTVTPERFEAAARNFPAARERIDVHYGYDGKGLDQGLASADILVGWQFPTRNFKQRAPKLRWIYGIGAGVDHLLPLDWLPEGVQLSNASGAHRPKVDEFMMATLLMLNNRYVEMMTNQRQRKFQMLHSRIIKGKTALMLGVGATGGAAAEAAKQLGMRTLGVRTSGAPHPAVDEMYRPADLGRVLPRADFVVVTVPKTSSTPYLGRRELEQFKRGAYLVNLGRASVVDYKALADLLRRGHIGAAVCDLEDPAEVDWDQSLWDEPNVFIVPHCGTNDPDLYTANAVRIFFENLERFLAGKPLENLIDRKAGC